MSHGPLSRSALGFVGLTLQAEDSAEDNVTLDEGDAGPVGIPKWRATCPKYRVTWHGVSKAALERRDLKSHDSECVKIFFL